MQEPGRRLDAVAYALGWLVLIGWLGLAAGWAAYLARLAGKLDFMPAAWWPAAETHLLLIAIVKLMVIGLSMGWIGVLLYRRHLRRPS
jgi:hypothetical protein